ncbi:MAG: hypothetical protein H7315_00945 [Herminiimonas sp.]|nr:hypothetical protein [Herminiimonas sp.]
MFNPALFPRLGIITQGATGAAGFPAFAGSDTDTEHAIVLSRNGIKQARILLKLCVLLWVRYETAILVLFWDANRSLRKVTGNGTPRLNGLTVKAFKRCVGLSATDE